MLAYKLLICKAWFPSNATHARKYTTDAADTSNATAEMQG